MSFDLNLFENDALSLIHLRELEQRAHFRVYFFGQFRVFHCGELLSKPSWYRTKAKTLFKWFVLNPGKLFSADNLVDRFWPTMPLDIGLRNLHVTIHYLRHLLEPDLPRRQESSYIRRSDNNFYWFEMDETWWTDIMSFQQALSRARLLEQCGNADGTAFYYRKIVAYCEKGFLPEDIDEAIFETCRAQYEALFMQVLGRLVEIYLAKKEWDEVLEYAYLALQIDPSYEQATKALVKVYVEQGNTAKALQLLDEFQDLLQRKLGLGLNKELRSLQEKILNGTYIND